MLFFKHKKRPSLFIARQYQDFLVKLYEQHLLMIMNGQMQKDCTRDGMGPGFGFS